MTAVREAMRTYLYAVSALSPQTVKLYKERLYIFCSFCENSGLELEQIGPREFRAFIEHVAQRVNPRSGRPVVPRTLADYARVTKCFLSWCSTYEDYFGCVKPGQLKAMRIPKVEKKIKECFTEDELNKLYLACRMSDLHFLRDRDRALISLLIDTGLRANEVCTLKLGHVHLDQSDPHVRIMGKGWKEREVGIGNRTRMDLHRYIQNHRRGALPGDVVFLSHKRGPLTRYSLDQIIYRLKELAGVTRKGGAHMFRRTYATMYVDAGGDVNDLKTLMGHEHLSTTEGYIENTSRRKARQRMGSVWDNRDRRRG